MPDIGHAIVVNVSTVSGESQRFLWGVPVIIGQSPATDKNTPKLFSSQSAIDTEHGLSSAITASAKSLIKQGVTNIYTVAMTTAGATPTVGEINAALASLNTLVASSSVHGVMLAGVHDTPAVGALRAWCDAQSIIFVVTVPPASLIAELTSMAVTAASENGVVVICDDPASVDDTAAVFLGAVMVTKPWNTLMWKQVNCDVKKFPNPPRLVEIEGVHANAIIELQGTTRISSGRTTSPDGVKYLDITRSKYYTSNVVRDAITTLRLGTEKIPFTAGGFSTIKASIENALEGLVNSGALERYVVTMPEIGDISAADKSARKINGVTAEATLVGEVESFEIALTIFA